MHMASEARALGADAILVTSPPYAVPTERENALNTLAMILNRQLRSIPVVIALSVALSIALSAIAVQSLIWFRVATGPALVLAGTVYGCVLAGLLQASREERYGAA